MDDNQKKHEQVIKNPTTPDEDATKQGKLHAKQAQAHENT